MIGQLLNQITYCSFYMWGTLVFEVVFWVVRKVVPQTGPLGNTRAKGPYGQLIDRI